MNMKYTKCFVTVGTTRFDRLCEYILRVNVLNSLKKLGCESITIQIGNSEWDDSKLGQFFIDNIEVTAYRFKDSIEADIRNSDLVISHAGAGSCLEVLEARKPLLVVVNEDLMDNHQLELAEQLHIDGHLHYCTCDTLESTITDVDFSLLRPLPKPDCSKFINFLNEIIVINP